MAGLSRATNVRLPSAKNLQADIKATRAWDFGIPIDETDGTTASYGVCDSTLLSYVPQKVYDLLLDKILDKWYVQDMASAWLTGVAKNISTNPCVAASLAMPMADRVPDRL